MTPNAPNPITTLANSFTALTESLESCKVTQGVAETAKDSETRHADALVTAKEKTSTAKDAVATSVTGVLGALDTTSAALQAVRDTFTE